MDLMTAFKGATTVVTIGKNLDKMLSSLPTGEDNELFKKKLEEYLKCKHGAFVNIRPLALKIQKKLMDIYYPLTLEPLDGEFSRTKKKENMIENIEELEFGKLFQASSKVLIEDFAGMGKSTLMKVLFLSIVEKIMTGMYEEEYIPFFIELRKYNKENNFESFLLKNFLLNSNNKELNNNDKKIKQKFLESKFIFFFDGFDEIIPEKKEEVIQEIIRFTNLYSKNYFVLSSRSEIGLDNFSNFFKYKIKTLSFDEGKLLLKKYIENDKEFFKQLEENKESLETFLQTPLLASLIYTAYCYKKDIPTSKEDLYARIYSALYEEHDSNSKENFSRKGLIERSCLDRVLNEFAFENIKTLKIEYTKYEISKSIQEILKKYNYDLNVSDVLKILTTGTCIFRTNGNQYFWCHKSMQEYFIARKIKERSDKDKIISYLLKNISNYTNILSFLYEMEPLLIKIKIFKILLDEFELYKEYPLELQESLVVRGEFQFYLLNQEDREKDISFRQFSEIFKGESFFRVKSSSYFLNFQESKQNIIPLVNLLIDKKSEILEEQEYQWETNFISNIPLETSKVYYLKQIHNLEKYKKEEKEEIISMIEAFSYERSTLRRITQEEKIYTLKKERLYLEYKRLLNNLRIEEEISFDF